MHLRLKFLNIQSKYSEAVIFKAINHDLDMLYGQVNYFLTNLDYMKHNYTANFLLKYLYRETSLTQSLEIEDLINNDQEVSEKFQELRRGYKTLPKVKFLPSDVTIENILNYSSTSQALQPSF